jgi:hypothetical protein
MANQRKVAAAAVIALLNGGRLIRSDRDNTATAS